MSVLQILVVDDDEVTRRLLKEVLDKEGYDVSLASSGEEAVQKMSDGSFSLILSDIRMLDVDGMAVLREAKRCLTDSIVILMTGFGSMEGAIGAIQEGAFDYISKPFKIDDLRAVIARAAKHWELLKSELKSTASGTPSASRSLIGRSTKIVEVYKMLARAGMSSSTVLITGESGTGKELVARAIHDHSERRDRKFTAINCGALPENLLESELFGHVKGAFTGASTDKLGLFEEASSGTLFLDEIGDISLPVQIKLLRVLQESEIRPLGSNHIRKVNVRVISATHRDLEALVRLGKFREDLYYRLKVIAFELPPLRHRMEDLSLLVEYFLSKYSIKNSKKISHISDEGIAALESYGWPGNIRELEHAIERAVAMTNTSVIFPEDLPLEITRNAALPVPSPLLQPSSSLEEVEKIHILSILRSVGFNKSKASEILQIDRATLYRKAQRLGIDLKGKQA